MKRMKVAISLLVALVAAPQFANVSNAAPVKEHRAGVSSNLTPLLQDDKALIPVIIQFTSAPTVADKEMLLEAGFLEPMVRYEIIPALQAVAPAASIKSILDEKRVSYVEHDRVIPWALDRATQVTRASDVWGAEYQADGQTIDTGFTGRGIGVAVVDSGVDATHPDLLHHSIANRLGLPAKTVANLKLVGRDSVGLYGLIIPVGNVVGPFLEANALGVDMPDTDTTGGHGTHVAGITSGNGTASDGKYKGAAPGANLIGFGAGEVLVVSSGLAAFDWIHNSYKSGNPYNIRVVNNSWGGAGDWNPNSAVTKAARKLVNEDGIAVVFAAGNDGGDGSVIDTSVWANIPEMISVANYYDRHGWLTGSSSRGLKSLPRTWPHVAAPGTQIISTAAAGKPVTYVCSGQDALIDEENPLLVPGERPNTEPTVIPVPIPTTVETDLVDGEGEVIGPYASCTGTSMAAPHVAGVIALVLEANPDLAPLQVRSILMATANMPDGRSYEADGYAIGAGVVDAAEAVAVALKMREGLSFKDALRTAYVDYDPSVHLNPEDARNIVIKAPQEGEELAGATVTVSGEFNEGPVTDNSIPLEPEPEPEPEPSVSGDPIIYRSVAGAALLAAQPQSRPVVAQGETVRPEFRFIQSSDVTLQCSGTDLTGVANFQVEHRILRNGVPIDASQARERGDTTGCRSWSTWVIPATQPTGEYVFEGSLTIDGETYPLGSVEFLIQGNPPRADIVETSAGTRATTGPSLPFPLNVMNETGASQSFYSTDFESGDDGWTIQQNATSVAGRQTNWNFIDYRDALIGFGWDAPHSGDSMFYAGASPAADEVSGYVAYTPGANTSLISPEMDLSTAGSAELSYWRLGASDENGDFLKVYAAPSGTTSWELVQSVSGARFDWEQATADLSEFAGQKIRIRFDFTSDSLPTTIRFLHGWYIDDVAVTGEAGGGGTPAPVIKPVLAATPDEGMAPLTTSLSYNVSSNAPIDKVELDFGDGSAPYVTTETAGTVPHTYEAGFWAPKVTAFSGTHTATASTNVDSIPANTIQVRIDGKPWVSAGTALNSDRDWSAVLDLAGLPKGDHTIQARHCDVDARCIYDSVGVVKIEPPVSFVPSEVSVNEGAGSVQLTAKLREASGSTVSATFTTVNGTAKSPSDYTAVSGTVTFAPGQTTRPITVPITNDTMYEGNETFKVVITDDLQRTAEATVTIVSNDPAPRISIEDKVVSEGEAGTTPVNLTVKLSNPSTFPLKVNFATRNGTAIAGSDYQAKSGTLTFWSGETTKTVTINVIGDVVDEDNENFFVDLSSPNGGVITDGTGEVTIFDEDGNTTPLGSSNTNWLSGFFEVFGSVFERESA